MTEKKTLDQKMLKVRANKCPQIKTLELEVLNSLFG